MYVYSESLFQAAAYLLNALRPDEPSPFGVSQVNILYTLSKQGRILGAYKLCRDVNARLARMRVKPLWQDQLDVNSTFLTLKITPNNPDDVHAYLLTRSIQRNNIYIYIYICLCMY